MKSNESLRAERVLATLHELMQAGDTDATRVRAAKILLERLAPKEDDEAQRREEEERETAIAEARGLLAEFAAAKLAGVREPREVDQTGAATATDAGG